MLSGVAAVVCVCFLFAPPARALEENKVIIRDFDWRVYSTEHFDIHYYGDSRSWLDYASRTLEAAYRREAADLNPSLSKRPMKRVITPLTEMGAKLTAEGKNDAPPLVIDGGPLPQEPSTMIDLTGDAPVIVREGKGDTAWIKSM